MVEPTLKTRLESLVDRGAKTRPSCVKSLELLEASTPASERRGSIPTRLVAVRVKADQAFLLYASREFRDVSMPAVRVDGSWDVGSLTGSDLSPP